MICPNCGKNNRTPKKFCYSCGSLLSIRGAGNSSSSRLPTAIDDGIWPFDPSPADASYSVSSQQQYASPPVGPGYGPSRLADSAPRDFVGMVSDLEKRTEQQSELGIRAQYQQRTLNIWTFRVTRRDDNGNPLPPPIPVEMRGYTFHGNVRDGDSVRIPRAWRAGETISTDTIYNLSTSSTVRASGTNSSYGTRIAGFFGGIFFSIIAYFMLQFGNSMAAGSAAPGSASFIMLVRVFCFGFIAIGILAALASLFGSGGRR